MKKIIIVILTAMLTLSLSGMTLSEELVQSIGDANIGVAIIDSNGDTIEINGDKHYPMMSVFKFHQAIAISQYLGYPGILTKRCPIDDGDMCSDTWSPMLRDFPGGLTSADLTLLLKYSLIESDNNACDIIFKNLLSPFQTDSLMHSFYPGDYAICQTEREMNNNISLCYNNYSTPKAAAGLVDKFFVHHGSEAALVVKALMGGTKTGLSRIKAGLGAGATLFHKTGTGHCEDGYIQAVNDIGIVLYTRPDGTTGYYSIAVFVKDFKGSLEEAEKQIADISNIAWRHLAVDFPKTLSNLSSKAPTVGIKPNVPEENPQNGPNFLGQLAGAMLEGILDGMLMNE